MEEHMLTFKQFLLESILTEKRKNPHLNPKISILDQLKNIASKYGTDSIYCTFAAVPKLGVYPKSTYATPLGIYAYPLKYVIEKELKVPFAGHQPYIVVFQVQPEANIWDLSNPDISPIKDKLITACTKFMPPKEDPTKYTSTIKTPKELWYYMYECIQLTHINSAVDRKQGILARKILTSIGLDGVIDPNDSGIIHENEPTQGIFFNTKAIKQIDLIDTASITPIAIITKLVSKQPEKATKSDLQKLSNLIVDLTDPDSDKSMELTMDGSIPYVLSLIPTLSDTNKWKYTAKIANQIMDMFETGIISVLGPKEAERARQYGLYYDRYHTYLKVSAGREPYSKDIKLINH